MIKPQNQPELTIPRFLIKWVNKFLPLEATVNWVLVYLLLKNFQTSNIPIIVFNHYSFFGSICEHSEINNCALFICFLSTEQAFQHRAVAQSICFCIYEICSIITKASILLADDHNYIINIALISIKPIAFQ